MKKRSLIIVAVALTMSFMLGSSLCYSAAGPIKIAGIASRSINRVSSVIVSQLKT